MHCWASLRGVASSLSLARAWGGRLPGSPREGPGKGVTWGVKGPAPSSGLPGPTDRAQPGPPPTPGQKQEQPLRVRAGEKPGCSGQRGLAPGPRDGEERGWGAGLHLHRPVPQLESEGRMHTQPLGGGSDRGDTGHPSGHRTHDERGGDGTLGSRFQLHRQKGRPRATAPQLRKVLQRQ